MKNKSVITAVGSGRPVAVGWILTGQFGSDDSTNGEIQPRPIRANHSHNHVMKVRVAEIAGDFERTETVDSHRTHRGLPKGRTPCGNSRDR